MTNLRTICAGALLVLGVFASSRPAYAQGRGFSFIIKISVEPSTGGTSIPATTGTINGSPFSLPEAKWTKTHSEKSPLFEGGISAVVGHYVDVVALLNYGNAGATSNPVGQIGNTPLTATLDDYNFWGMEGGVHFRHPSGIGPYATVTVGFRRISEIDAGLAGVGVTRGATVYNASVVPTIAFGGGILWGDRRFAIGIEVAARYAGAPSMPASQPNLPAGDTLQFASGAGARWSLPVGLVLRF